MDLKQTESDIIKVHSSINCIDPKTLLQSYKAIYY